MHVKLDITGVILAGGKNSRLPGKKKTFHRVGDATMLERLTGLFANLFTETIVVVNDPGAFSGVDEMVVTDIIPARCALAGLHTGLFYASNPYAYVTACDIPFASEAVIRYLAGKIDNKAHVIIPGNQQGMVEPLSAVYSKECLPLIEETLAKNIRMIRRFFKKKRVKEIPIQVLKKLDPDLRFMFNVNTPDDLATAKLLADDSAGPEDGRAERQTNKI